MKTVKITKETLPNNTLLVSYFDPTAVRREIKFNTPPGIWEIAHNPDIVKEFKPTEEVEVAFDKMLFCEKLTWQNSENEFDEVIEQRKLALEQELNAQ